MHYQLSLAALHVRNKFSHQKRKVLAIAMSGIIYAVYPSAYADDAASQSDAQSDVGTSDSSSSQKKAKQLDTVSVVGSQIAGGGAEAALPVLSFDAEQVDATGATDGNELIRSLPQMGDVTWNPTWLGGGNSNAARGDIGSISLRSVGASNTLLLINGRRSVIHPTTATVDGAISTTTYNSNAIPMFGLERMDMLLDGAAAIYGSDAIAGVVNVVTRQNLPDGGGIKFEYGKAAGTNRHDVEVDGYFGHDFAEGRGNVTVMYGFTDRTSEYTKDEWYTATSGMKKLDNGVLVPGGTDSGLSTTTPYGRFEKFSNGSKTGSSTYYTMDENGGVKTGATPPVLYDANAEPGVTLSPAIKRGSIFSNARYDINDNVQLYGELNYYQAKSKSWIGSATTSTTQPVYIASSVSTVPEELAEGADAIRISNYRFADGGIRPVVVNNYQARALLGLKGWTDGGWNWDTGLLWSQSYSDDDMIGVDVTKFVEAVNSGEYNPFNGGGTLTGDTTASDTSSFMVHTHRKDKARLALWDFKVNRPDLFTWYAGDIGMAAGVEYRYESLEDNRDAIIDGTYKYTDWYTGEVYDSNFFGHSSTPDSYGSRNVRSAFVEFAVPLVGSDQSIPLVKSLDLQVAGRYEKYSDVGDVAKPKFALAWKAFESLLLRGSLSQGFKAPNLELVNSSVMYRFNSYDDAVRCSALVAKGAYENYLACDSANVLPGTGTSQTYSVRSVRTGNQNLKPELSKNRSYGFVFEPTFIPDKYGKFSFGMDWWRIEIENPIGMLNDQYALYYDAYLRVTQGTSNPNVVRYDVTQADIDQFAGSGLDPVGEVAYVNATYTNMNPIVAKGVDYNFSWRLAGTQIGDFSFILNAAKLSSYTQQPTSEMQAVQAAIDSGALNLMIASVGASNLVGQYNANIGVKPEWRASATLIWKYDDWTVRIRDQYIDSVVYGLYADGSDYLVPSTNRWNLSVKRELKDGFLKGFSVEVGGRNIFDKDPPLNASGSYLASLYEPYGAYYYMSLQKTW